jgi:hypothetical protein
MDMKISYSKIPTRKNGAGLGDSKLQCAFNKGNRYAGAVIEFDLCIYSGFSRPADSRESEGSLLCIGFKEDVR